MIKMGRRLRYVRYIEDECWGVLEKVDRENLDVTACESNQAGGEQSGCDEQGRGRNGQRRVSAVSLRVQVHVRSCVCVAGLKVDEDSMRAWIMEKSHE